MNGKELKTKFTQEFFEEFQYDSEFRSIFFAIEQGSLTPYKAIEHLCKSKKYLLHQLEESIKNTPRKIIVANERFEELKKEV